MKFSLVAGLRRLTPKQRAVAKAVARVLNSVDANTKSPSDADTQRRNALAALRRELALRPPAAVPRPSPPKAPRSPPKTFRAAKATPEQLQLNKDLQACRSVEEVLAVVASKASVFNNVNAATALLAMSRLVRGPEPPAWLRGDARFAQLLSTASSHFGEMDERGLTNTLYAVAKLGAAPDDWMARYWDASAGLVPTFAPQALSNTLYASAKLQVTPPAAWMDLYWKAAVAKLPDYGPQACTNTLYACSMLGLQPPAAWVDRFWANSSPRLGSYKSQELSNVMYSCGAMSLTPPAPWLTQLWSAFDAKLGLCNAQDLANTLHACVRLRLTPLARLLSHIWELSASKLGAFRPQELSSLLFGFGHLRQAPPGEWWQRFWRVSIGKLPDFKPQELSNTCFMCGELDAVPPAEWAQAFSHACDQSASRMTRQQLGNIALALTILALWDLPLWRDLWPRLCSALSHDSAHWSHEESLTAMMLYQTYCAAELERPGLLPAPEPALLAAVRAHWEASVRKPQAESSRFHDKVSEFLRAMGVAHVNERWCERAERSIDIAVEGAGAGPPIALEVDGPYHFLQDGRQDGRTQLRNRMLAAHGWRVQVVDYRAWKELRTEAQRREYLRSLLA